MSAKPKRKGKKKSRAVTKTVQPASGASDQLLTDLRELILVARRGVARAIDSGLVALYWQIGRRIRQDILQEKRAEYGKEIVSSVGRQLEREFGRGFSAKSLHHMIRFTEAFPDEEIVSAVRRQLTWTHFKTLAYLDNPLKRDFYTEMCRVENWNTRTLQNKIQSMLFERTALSKKPDKLIRQELDALKGEDKFTPDLVFRDPYILDFLGLADTYSEKDLEAAILREIESFILELGVGFCFVERQKRMQIDSEDYYLDLLFYHRKLHRLVAIDLKIGDFQAADKGQMELYLAWLKRHATEPDEELPLGIILCAGKNEQHVELLEPEKSGIHVAKYWMESLPKAALEQKLRDTVRLARARLESREEDSPMVCQRDKSG